MNTTQSNVMANDAIMNLPQFPNTHEEIKKAKAEKRLNARLRKIEVEQKAALLEECQQREEEERRIFESRKTQGLPPLPEEDIFREMRQRQELRALEQEQKEELLRLVLEKRAKELGDKWPEIEAKSKMPQYDHIPLLWPSFKEFEENASAGKANCKNRGIK